MQRRHAAIASATTPLPGSVPYVNRRPIHITAAYDGWFLIDALDTMFPFVGRQRWEQHCREGLLLHKEQPASGDMRIVAGQRFENLFPDTVEPDVNAEIRILFEDDCLVAVNKPAPLPMHPCGRFNRNTLISILNGVYYPQKLRIAHRIDANTSGLVLLSRTGTVAARVQPQFERREVFKRYLARVIGHPTDDAFVCDGSIGTRPRPAGARVVEPDGQASRTECRVLERLDDGTALVEAQPITGRTNQIRIHLWDRGFPIAGDPMYRPGGRIEAEQTLGIDAPPLCLHAWQIELTHPRTCQRIRLTAPLPSWCPIASLE
ncbi:MAG: RluA family pseudouridine synthase [Planctomycetales bacterium]|nr:RluA family pseudouridine synthase [Planctomycetales bacterium]